METHTRQPYEDVIEDVERLHGRLARETMNALHILAYSHQDDAVTVTVSVGDDDPLMYLVPIGDLGRSNGQVDRFFIEWQSNNARPQRMPRLFCGAVQGDTVYDCSVVKWHDLGPADWKWLARIMRSHAPRI